MTTLNELMSLQNRCALITGATGRLGSVIADVLAEFGADLILVDHPRTDFKPLIDSLRTRWNIQIWHYICDLEQQEQRLELLNQLKNKHKKLNVLINNAALVGTSDIKGWSSNFEDQKVETWRRALEINLTAPFHLSQSLTPLMKKSQGANIINVGSIHGEYAPDWELYKDTNMASPAAYGASKGGLKQLTRWLATTLAPDIRVNTISPGGVFRNQPEIFVKRYEHRTPLGRMAKEDDIRGGIVFLASDLSSYVTGQCLAIDGGWGVW